MGLSSFLYFLESCSILLGNVAIACTVFSKLKYLMLIGLVCPDAEALLEQLLTDELLGEEDDILDSLRLQESVLTKPASQPRSLQPYKQGCRRRIQSWVMFLF